jgi:hypothetical protein
MKTRFHFPRAYADGTYDSYLDGELDYVGPHHAPQLSGIYVPRAYADRAVYVVFTFKRSR